MGMNANNNLHIITNGQPSIEAITTLITPSAVSRVVSTRLPVNRITFSNGASVEISGSLTLKFKGGRRHLAGGTGLSGRRLQTAAAGEEFASFGLSIALVPEEKEPIKMAGAAAATAATVGAALSVAVAVLLLTW